MFSEDIYIYFSLNFSDKFIVLELLFIFAFDTVWYIYIIQFKFEDYNHKVIVMDNVCC